MTEKMSRAGSPGRNLVHPRSKWDWSQQTSSEVHQAARDAKLSYEVAERLKIAIGVPGFLNKWLCRAKCRTYDKM